MINRQDELPSDVPVAQDGFPLFFRAIGGFVLGSVATALSITFFARPKEVMADDEVFQLAMFCDVGASLMAGAILFSVLSTLLSRSHHALRARGWGASIGLGILYQVLPGVLLPLLASLDLPPEARRAVTFAHIGHVFIYPALISPLLVSKVRADCKTCDDGVA